MSRKRSIPQTFLLNMVAISALSTVLAASVVVLQEIRRFEQAADEMQRSYLEDRKAALRKEVDDAVAHIERRRQAVAQTARRQLRERVELACGAAGNLYAQYRDTLAPDELHAMVLACLRGFQPDESSGVLFAAGMDGTIKIFPDRPDVEGQSWASAGDAFAAVLALARAGGAGFHPPQAVESSESATLPESLYFAMRCDPLDWVIGARLDGTALDEDLRNEALGYLAHSTHPTGEYLFAGQWDGLSLSGPAVGQNMLDTTDPHGVKIVRSLIDRAREGGGFVTYVMPKFEGQRPEPKISYAKGIPDWGWYVGTGVYIDDINATVAAFRATRRADMMRNVGTIVLFLLALCLGSYYFARQVSRKTRAALEGFASFFRDAASGESVPDAVGLGFTEFDELAAAANRMVAQRQDAERALRTSEARLRILFAQAADAIYVSSLDGRLEQVNEQACIATGYSEEELLAMNVTEVDAEHGDPERVQAFFALLAREGSTTLLSQHRRKDGTVFPVEIRVALLESPGGTHVFGIARDISARLQLEAQLRQAQKLEAIGQLTGGVAHDFNNLLQVINAGTGMALADLDATHRARPALQEVMRAGENAAALVRQLLAFGRRQIIHPVALEVDEAISDILRLLRRVIGEHITIDWIADSDRATIMADRGMLEQTVMNLCVNARDAMPDGGVIMLRTGRAFLDQEACQGHPAAVPGEFAVIAVSDTGCGMEPEVLERIYEPFFSTKEEGKGTGLGLATVYGIMEQHRGLVRAESMPGKGTVVRLYWPRCEPEKAAAVAPGVRSVDGGTETILLAEDDPMVARMTATLLETAGYTVLRAENGLEAVALFEEYTDAIDLTILDVVMPKMGGREAYDLIRARKADARVLFASGYSVSAIDNNRVLEDGFTLLPKPFTRADLLAAVRRMLDADHAEGHR